MLQESVPNELPLGDNRNLWVIAIAENNTQQHEWFDEKFVETPNLQIPPEVFVQYGTLVYTMDQRAHEWEQYVSMPILLILAALKFSHKNLLTFIRFLFVNNRVGHLAISFFNKLLYCDIFN